MCVCFSLLLFFCLLNDCEYTMCLSTPAAPLLAHGLAHSIHRSPTTPPPHLASLVCLVCVCPSLVKHIMSVSTDILDQWVATVKECKYLPENDLKTLCELVSNPPPRPPAHAQDLSARAPQMRRGFWLGGGPFSGQRVSARGEQRAARQQPRHHLRRHPWSIL